MYEQSNLKCIETKTYHYYIFFNSTYIYTLSEPTTHDEMHYYFIISLHTHTRPCIRKTCFAFIT